MRQAFLHPGMDGFPSRTAKECEPSLINFQDWGEAYDGAGFRAYPSRHGRWHGPGISSKEAGTLSVGP